MNNLEDYRNNDYGNSALFLSTTPPIKLYVNYNNFCNLAYSLSALNITELENSKTFLNNGTRILPAVSMCFLSIDSFFNSILKLAFLKLGIEYRDIIKLSLSAKYQLLIQKYNLKADRELNAALFQRVKDLETFNAFIPIDVFEEEKPQYVSSNFSTNSMLVNQLDNMQALIIISEVFEAFRFVIAGLDLMPNISISTNDSRIFFDKFSVLLHKVILPAFKDILIKHKLSVNSSLLSSSFNFPVSDLFIPKQILMIQRILEDNEYKTELNRSATNILGDFHSIFMKKFEGNNDKNLFPNFSEI